jgi:hypothetical protein
VAERSNGITAVRNACRAADAEACIAGLGPE